MKALVYTRVSTDEQTDGYSLDAQRIACERFVELRGWTLAGVYTDPGFSGTTDNRPDFQRMMADAHRGVGSVIVVHKLDRFSRSLLDVMLYLSKLQQAGIQFVSITEQFDFTTPHGKAMLTMIATFAQWYVDNLSWEISKGKRQRAKSGGWNGGITFGYTTKAIIRRGKITHEMALLLSQYPHVGETESIPHPANRLGVAMAFTDYATGRYSDDNIATLLNANGYKTTRGNGFTASTVADMLRNRFYLGWVSLGGGRIGSERYAGREWIPGNHQPLVSEEVFNTCQDIRSTRKARYNTRRNSQHFHTLAGILYCHDCGEPLTGWFHRGERKYRDRNTECKHPQKHYPATRLEENFSELIGTLSLPPDWKTLVMEQAMIGDEKPIDRKSIEERLRRLRYLYVNGDITEAEYTNEKRLLNQQLEDDKVVDLDAIGAVAELIDNLALLWQEATDEERREIAIALFEKVYVDRGEIVAVQATTIYWSLVTATTYPQTERTGISTQFGYIVYSPVRVA